MNDPAATPKGVLSYLADMIKLCRRLHRHDLEEQYRDAWETAASAIYGPLPPPVMLASAVGCVMPVEKKKTQGQLDMLAKPYRKIRLRFEDYEILECGHRVWQPADLPEVLTAKRRRCAECARSDSSEGQAGSAPVLATSETKPLAAADVTARTAGSKSPAAVREERKEGLA